LDVIQGEFFNTYFTVKQDVLFHHSYTNVIIS